MNNDKLKAIYKITLVLLSSDMSPKSQLIWFKLPEVWFALLSNGKQGGPIPRFKSMEAVIQDTNHNKN